MLSDRLVAHRGYQAHYPENTLLGFTKAIAAGAHFIETDILFSSDHQPVLYHDALMNRISGAENAIHLLTLSELKTYPASEPERLGDQFIDEKITTLTELVTLLSTNPQVTAFIELKRSGLHIEGIENAYNIVTKLLQTVITQCVLISFSDDFIHYAWQQGYQRLGLVLKQWDELEGDLITSIRPEFIFCDTKIVPEQITLDSIESKVVIYEVTHPENAIHWYKRGADLVETFDYGGMMSGLINRTL
jgi:glycerophosphoryl diester phosphodiesterase